MAVTRLDVMEIATGEIVESIDVSGQTERGAERVLSGLLINMNTDEYCVNEVEG